ncbi:MAG: elongation factor 1-beta [Methermicoccaceae archaeon]
MGDVGVKMRVMPESVDTDLEMLKERIGEVLPEGARLHAFSIEPVAFGLKALVVAVILADAEGGTEEVERAISSLDGVESVNVVEVGLI